MGAGGGRGVRRLRGCLAAVGAVALCLAALAGGIWYRVEVAPTEVLTDVSPDGMYELTIDRVGEPDWPFGATHCRFTLHGEGRQILERAFSIQDDGAVARADNFAVRWRADGHSGRRRRGARGQLRRALARGRRAGRRLRERAGGLGLRPGI